PFAPDRPGVPVVNDPRVVCVGSLANAHTYKSLASNEKCTTVRMSYTCISERSRRSLILALVAVAQMMVMVDLTVMYIALPSAQKALHFSNGDGQWIVAVYALAFGAVLPMGGRLSDLFGRKRMLVLGLVGFAGISAIAGMARSFWWL